MEQRDDRRFMVGDFAVPCLVFILALVPARGGQELWSLCGYDSPCDQEDSPSSTRTSDPGLTSLKTAMIHPDPTRDSEKQPIRKRSMIHGLATRLRKARTLILETTIADFIQRFKILLSSLMLCIQLQA
nr:hypothetical protein CFP56_26048 [Quercus suber]